MNITESEIEHQTFDDQVVLLREVLRKIYACCLNAADMERLFSQLGPIVTPNKTRLKDSTITQKSVIPADVRLHNQLERESRGEQLKADRLHKLFVDSGSALKRLRALDLGASVSPENMSEVVPIANAAEQRLLAGSRPSATEDSPTTDN